MDATTATFEAEVLQASKALPVVVDFWAPWCGPCKALTPVLEKVAKDYEGRVKLVKINSDENQELSTALSIRSIPNVIAFKDGKPVAQFMGAVPASQVRAFFDKLLPSPSQLALMQAAEALDQGRVDEAEQGLAAVDVETDPALVPKVDTLRQAITFARAQGANPGGQGEPELRARLAANPADHEARAALAAQHAGAKRWREALDELLEILRRAKGWKDGEARRQALAIFNLAGDAELVSEYRRKLASLLN
jgi:putative thioredoxin